MASPLGWFRRHQKGMMVVFGMVLMAIFGLGSVAMMINPSQITNPADKETVVKWDGGSLSRTQVENIRIRHFATKRFVRGVEALARTKQEDFFPAAFPINWLDEAGLNMRDVDFAIVERFLMAQKAADEGIVVSDAMVNDYISLVHNMVDMTPGELEGVNIQVNGEQMDLVDIRRHLKMELAAQQYRFLLDRGFPITPTPTEAAELYTRLEKTIECTVMPVDVEDFIDKVEGTPSNSELKKIFEKGQYVLENSDPKRPGFKRAKRAKIQYVYAKFNDFLKAEMDKISDKEVQEEYDRLVEAKDSLVMEFVPPEEPTTPEGGDDPAPKQDEGSEAGDDAAPKPPGDDDPAPKPGESDAKEAETEQGDDSKENAESGDAESGNADESEKKSESKGDEGKEEGDGLSLTARTNSQFVSTRVQDEETEKQESGEETKETTDPQTGEDAKEGSEQAEGEGENQSEEPKMLDEGKQDGEATDPLDGVTLPGEDDQDEGPILMKPKPLNEDLARMIRERMVATQAMNKLQDQIAQAEADVREQQYEYADWDSQTDAEKANSEPNITLDLKELADRLGLSYGETELLNRKNMYDDEQFGARRGIVEIPRRFGPPQRSTVPMADIVFSALERLSVYEPGEPVVEEGTQTNILWWPCEVAEMEVLTFSEAKPAVLEYWKREQAKELAKQHALDLANQLNAKKERMLDAYPEKSQNTGSFTWYSNGFTRPTGVEAPGDAFMETAYGLNMEQCGAALNETGTYAYVIQKIFQDSRDDGQISETLLSNWTKFKMIPPNVSGAIRQQSAQYRMDSRRKIMDEMNVKWVSE